MINLGIPLAVQSNTTKLTRVRHLADQHSAARSSPKVKLNIYISPAFCSRLCNPGKKKSSFLALSIALRAE